LRRRTPQQSCWVFDKIKNLFDNPLGRRPKNMALQYLATSFDNIIMTPQLATRLWSNWRRCALQQICGAFDANRFHFPKNQKNMMMVGSVPRPDVSRRSKGFHPP